jgi:uncharacterized protein
MIQSTFVALFIAVISSVFFAPTPELFAQSKTKKQSTKTTKPASSIKADSVKGTNTLTPSAMPASTPSQAVPTQTTPTAPQPSTGAAPPMTGSTMPTFQAATQLPVNASPRPMVKVTFANVEVVLPTTTGTLYGTLTIPQNASTTATVPFVLLLNTNTVFDRNGYSFNNRDSSMHIKYLAESLAMQGIASLRYDTRGVGKSMMALKGEDYLNFETTVRDAANWITQIRKDKRFSTITVMGMGLPNDYGREASLVAILVTQRMKTDGLVCVAGESRKHLSMIRSKAKTTFPEQTANFIDSLAQVLERGKKVAITPADGVAYNLFRPAILPYVMELSKYDPRAEMAKVVVPSLVVHGAMDYSISADVVQDLANAQSQAQFVKIQNMSAFMKNGNEDFATMPLQKHKVPISEVFAKVVIEYIFSVNKQ